MPECLRAKSKKLTDGRLAMRSFSSNFPRLLIPCKTRKHPPVQFAMRILSKSLQQVQRNNSTIATLSSFFDKRTSRTSQKVNFNSNINEKIRLLSTDEKRSDESTKSLGGKKSDLAFYFKKYGYFFPVYWISVYATCGG